MTSLARGIGALVVGSLAVGAVVPKRIRVAAVFDVVWNGKEPLSLMDVKERDGQLIMILGNETKGIVDGVEIESTPPPEGGCKAVTHPFGNPRGVGRYAEPAGSLNLAPAGSTEIRVSAAEIEAWTKRRKRLRCAPVPSLIWLNRVCLRDGSEWTPAGWNIDRSARCPHPDQGGTPRQ